MKGKENIKFEVIIHYDILTLKISNVYSKQLELQIYYNNFQLICFYLYTLTAMSKQVIRKHDRSVLLQKL